MPLPLRLLAALLAATALSGCASTGGPQPGSFDTLLDVARLLADLRDYSNPAAGQAGLFEGRSQLARLEASITKLADSQAKRDLKNGTAAFRSAFNGSAYLLDSIQAMKANRTHDAAVGLYAAWGSFNEAQRFAANVSDPELRAAMDFGPMKAEIERLAAGLPLETSG